MKYILILFLLPLSFIKQGFGQSEFVEKNIISLYEGKFNFFKQNICEKTQNEIGFYLDKDSIFSKITNTYQITIINQSKKDSLWNIEVLINNNNFLFKVIEVKNKKYQLLVDENTFIKLFYEEPVISYNIGSKLFELGYFLDSFAWVYQSAKTGYPFAQLFLFREILSLFGFDPYYNEYYDKMNEIIEVEAKVDLIKTGDKQRIIDQIEQFKIGTFLQYYDPERLILIYKKKAETGDTEYMNRLANIYPLFKRDYKNKEHLNAYWYTQSALKGNELAMEQIGSYYESEAILGVNYEKSFYWYNKLYEQNDSHHVIIKLIYSYYYGRGVKQNREKALELFNRAKDLARYQKDSYMLEGIGHIYYGDILELQDFAKAIKNLKASDSYSSKAIKRIKKLEELGF